LIPRDLFGGHPNHRSRVEGFADASPTITSTQSTVPMTNMTPANYHHPSTLSQVPWTCTSYCPH
jgi:hypothetical protein